MKIVLVSSVLWISSLLVSGVLSADGDVGSPCATADTCSDGDAFCDTSDTASKKCRCRLGFVPDGAACSRGWGGPCDRGMCLDHGVCTAQSTCSCDTDKHFLAGTNGSSSCACDSNFARSGDKCLKRVGQPCSSSADCLTTDGMLCAVRGGANKCTCDTTKNYDAGTDGDITCSCATDHFKRADKVCGLVVGQNCTGSGKLCVDGAVCDPQNSTCKCDPAKFFLPGSDGDTSCSCDTSISVQKADGSCGLKVGQPCQRSSAAKACGPHASCNTTSYLCACAGGVTRQNSDGTCSKSHASRAGTSFSLLTSALLVASWLLA